ncbi:hypothetical protein KC220_25035, partial [Mycobacterium tuberculosis]|nr:hypothetical protein [Mycobacterium tuberculosis]
PTSLDITAFVHHLKLFKDIESKNVSCEIKTALLTVKLKSVHYYYQASGFNDATLLKCTNVQ